MLEAASDDGASACAFYRQGWNRWMTVQQIFAFCFVVPDTLYSIFPWVYICAVLCKPSKSLVATWSEMSRTMTLSGVLIAIMSILAILCHRCAGAESL